MSRKGKNKQEQDCVAFVKAGVHPMFGFYNRNAIPNKVTMTQLKWMSERGEVVASLFEKKFVLPKNCFDYDKETDTFHRRRDGRK